MIFVLSDGLFPTENMERPIPGKRFTAPLSENDISKTISLSDKIRQTFSEILDSDFSEKSEG